MIISERRAPSLGPYHVGESNMPLEWTADPVELGLDPVRFDAALDGVRSWCDRRDVPAVGLTVGRGGLALRPRTLGRQHPDREDPLRDDAIFTVASITKPIVAMGVLLLVERGQLALSDRVTDYIPEFAGKGRYGIRVRHLLTHTSGLPDMLPHDRELRRARAPLSKFLTGVCETEPSFVPGRGVAYSSCGFVLLGEIVARITGRPLPEFLREQVFEPLEMHDTSLGASPAWFDDPDRFASVRLPDEQAAGDDWNWNSLYWRTLGAPWGGLLSTPADLAHFASAMLPQNSAANSLFSTATLSAATSNQLEAMREIPEPERRCRPWGLGWRLHWPAHGAYFGDLLSPQAFGHWGATGTLLWVDPTRKIFAVLLTTQPQDPDGPWLARLSNAVAAAFH